MEISRPKKYVYEKSDSEDESEETPKRPRKLARRHLDSPPASPSPAAATSPSTSPIRSNEAVNFERSIARGSWVNVFRRFGDAIVANKGAMLEGVNLDLFDSQGLTALHSAILVRNKALTLLLLKKGARHQLATLSGWTAWHLAAREISILHAMLDSLRPKMA